ncbi:NAD(P)H-binding protein [Actinophytocola sp.]|uniref:NAD(P)H-binding protein n=1 Tax=Actinophytocola sp. TaxID=1872138 RepID=UPI002ED02B35
MNNAIVVLGATGKTGRRLVRTLRDAGEPVRPASRSSEARFDWTDQDTWPAVLDGASAVYLVAPGEPEPVHAFVKQATEAGVRRFVALSARALDEFSTEFFQGMHAAEQAVRSSGVEWTILRPNNFSQNFDEDVFHAPLLAGRLALPIGAVPEPFIDVRDIADVAAAALSTDGHHEKVYDLSGPRALTFAAAVEKIATASGRTIHYEELTPDEFRDELLAEGLDEHTAAELNALFAGMRAGLSSEPRDGVRQVLGRAPIDFDTYVSGAWA